MSIKEQIIARVKELPETATLSDIREEFEILAAIDEGLADIKCGRHKTAGEVEGMLSEWVTK